MSERAGAGLCEEWDPAEGGNTALLFARDGLAAAPVPDEGVTLLPEACGIDRVPVGTAGYDDARTRWATDQDRSPRHVLGQLGGEPSWLQHEEHPACTSCERPMDFVAQFEEGHDASTSMNFGGGCGYAFACAACRRGVFLWQC